MKQFPSLVKLKDMAQFYYCGGCVRDYLLKRKPKDYDFVVVTTLSFEQIVKVLSIVGRVLVEKPEFLIIKAKIDGEVIDIAYPRTEGTYSDNRRPDSTHYTDSLLEDSKRRDFTMNAMYMHIETGEIIDFHNGKYDIENKLIRTVGCVTTRFGEDYIRPLRAIRFATELGFEILPYIETQIYCFAQHFPEIAPDRIREELNKGFSSNPRRMMELLTVDGDVIKYILECGIRFEATQRGKNE